VRALISFVIRNRAVFFKPFPKDEFLLDIGPGANISDRFYNVDYEWQPGIHRCLDITKGIGLPLSGVAGAFTEHCLEHISIGQCLGVLREIHGALIEHAWLRIVVPDLELYARQNVQSLESGQNVMPYRSAEIEALRTAAVPFNIVMREHGHKFFYDFETLGALLGRVGFRNITRCTFSQGHDPKLLRDTEHRRAESLYVEAQK
jgi:predicted SAM-dependent methyltransferase